MMLPAVHQAAGPSAFPAPEESAAGRSDVPGEPREGARLGDPSSMLEQEGYKAKQVRQSVTEEKEEDFVKAVAVRCNSWMCEECKKRKGYEFRKRLLQKTELFREPRLFTVTVAREWHESAEAAYEYVSAKGYINTLMRLLGIRRWVWVLEAQEKTGEGWPHWHILIDVSDLPARWYHSELKVSTPEQPSSSDGWTWIPHFVDYARIGRLLRKWRIGEQCCVSGGAKAIEGPEHAINYITKYLVKMPRRGFPGWMLNRPRIRFMGASRQVGALVAAEGVECLEKTKENEEEPEERSECRTPVERIAECGLKTVLIRYSEETDRHELVARVDMPRTAVEKCPWAVSVENFDFETLQPFTSWGFGSVAAAWQFAEVCEDRELQQLWRKQVERRKDELLGMWESSGSGEGSEPGENSGGGCENVSCIGDG